MYRKYVFIGWFLLFVLLFSCKQEPDLLEQALQLAGDNRPELEKVLEHYKNDSLKQNYARYLIENMPGHYSVGGEALNAYQQMVDSLSESVRMADINKKWQALSAGLKSKQESPVPDLRQITAGYLIAGIDHASQVVQSQAWSNRINEFQFCKYILPYRVTDEPLSDYHETFYQAYQPLVEGITDVNKAFFTVYRHVLDHFSLSTPDYPDTPDVLTIHKLQSGMCAHRCVYLVCVLRSLGIPAAYDYVSTWANYSPNGHTWVSLIGPREDTFSVFENDTLAKPFNRIDGSLLSGADFVAAHRDKVSQRVDSVKKVSKIYRHTYSIAWENRSVWISAHRPAFFNNPHAQDVSGAYGLSGFMETAVPAATDYAFLYTFAAVQNWQPSAYARVKRRKAVFEQLGTEVVYLPVVCKNAGPYQAVGYPVLLQADGGQRQFKPDTTQFRTVVLKRKYPLYSQWIRRGNNMVGGRFEGSQTPDFRRPVLLYCITDIPLHATRVSIEVPEAFRYVRYLPPGNTRFSIAETAYYTSDEQGNESLLQGRPIGHRIETEYIVKAFDRNYSTYTETPLEYYWFGLDLGAKRRISRIEYCPMNDGNLIEPGTDYELFYWDNEWRSLGRTRAIADSLVYTGAPENALLWLKCHAGGREERIFTYEEGKQIWW